MFKNEFAAGRKKNVKQRLSELLTYNMTGTVNKTSLVIDSRKSHFCFNGVKNITVNCAHSRNSWITTAIYTNFLLKWDN